MFLLKKGEKSALTELIEGHQKSLANFFCKLGGSRTDAEDLIQETFLRVYKAAKNYEVKAKFSTFLYMLARHTWIDHLRHKGRRITETTEYPLELVKDEDKRIQHVEAAEEVQRHLNRLSDKYRDVVVLSFFMKFKYAEIAEQLDIPIGTVRSRLHEAMKRLREMTENGDHDG